MKNGRNTRWRAVLLSGDHARERRLAVAGVSCVTLGVGALALEHAPEPYADAARLGGPWLLVAFIVGRMARRPLSGAAAGIAVLLAATAVYYAVKNLWGSELNPATYDRESFWYVIAGVVGAVFGGAGGLSVSAQTLARTAAVAVLAGLVMWDAALLFMRVPVLQAVVVCCGVAIPLMFLTSKRERVVGVAGAFAVCGGALLARDWFFIVFRFG